MSVRHKILSQYRTLYGTGMYERVPQNVTSIPGTHFDFDQFRHSCFYAYRVYNLLIFIVSILQVLPLQLLKDSYRVGQDCRMVKGN